MKGSFFVVLGQQVVRFPLRRVNFVANKAEFAIRCFNDFGTSGFSLGYRKSSQAFSIHDSTTYE